MDKWKGKIAVVTGASAGIGAAIVEALAKSGLIVVGLARRPQMIEENVKSFPENYGKVYARSCDISSLESIREAFKWIEENLGTVNILVNNAGIGKKTTILNNNSEVDEQFADIINTNFTGLVQATRHAYLLMKKSDDYGIIININSVTGHKSINFMRSEDGQQGNVYYGTKHAVTATTEILRQELIAMKNNKIRVTSVSPGIVETDFFHSGNFLPENMKMKEYAPALDASDVSDIIIYLLQVPYHVNLTEVIVKPVGEQF